MDMGKVRDAVGLRFGVEAVDEARLDTGAHAKEVERVDGRIAPGREAARVLVRLQLDAGQGVADSNPAAQTADDVSWNWSPRIVTAALRAFHDPRPASAETSEPFRCRLRPQKDCRPDPR